MSDILDSVTDPVLRTRLTRVKERLHEGLSSVDSFRRLSGKPVSYHLIAGHTLEIAFCEVPKINESEVLAVKRLIGEKCFCTVEPRAAETLTVRFVVELTGS